MDQLRSQWLWRLDLCFLTGHGSHAHLLSHSWPSRSCHSLSGDDAVQVCCMGTPVQVDFNVGKGVQETTGISAYQSTQFQDISSYFNLVPRCSGWQVGNSNPNWHGTHFKPEETFFYTAISGIPSSMGCPSRQHKHRQFKLVWWCLAIHRVPTWTSFSQTNAWHRMTTMSYYLLDLLIPFLPAGWKALKILGWSLNKWPTMKPRGWWNFNGIDGGIDGGIPAAVEFLARRPLGFLEIGLHPHTHTNTDTMRPNTEKPWGHMP